MSIYRLKDIAGILSERLGLFVGTSLLHPSTMPIYPIRCDLNQGRTFLLRQLNKNGFVEMVLNPALYNKVK